ncbi:hypothetical protein B0H13DRAFT_2339898 [Mycena leptocephala]|nr:hypothetical protein B0H13DRAFT_2339898 [Mycena leptocephala]
MLLGRGRCAEYTTLPISTLHPSADRCPSRSGPHFLVVVATRPICALFVFVSLSCPHRTTFPGIAGARSYILSSRRERRATSIPNGVQPDSYPFLIFVGRLPSFPDVSSFARRTRLVSTSALRLTASLIPIRLLSRLHLGDPETIGF